MQKHFIKALPEASGQKCGETCVVFHQRWLLVNGQKARDVNINKEIREKNPWSPLSGAVGRNNSLNKKLVPKRESRQN